MFAVPDEIEINLLGPLEVRRGGRDVTPSAPKPRHVLALLALNLGRPTSVRELAAELWDDRPPRSAKTTLQTYILQLRKVLEPDGAGDPRCPGTRLITRPNGYLLRLPPDCLDVGRLADLLDCAELAEADGDLTSAAVLLGAAGALWRGPTLADVEPGPQLRVELARLAELRLTAIESYASVMLRLGRHREVLAELAGHVASHPAHEPLHVLYMTALYRSNRRMQALQVFRMLDRTLRHEHGLGPSLPAQRLHLAMLEDAAEDAPGVALALGAAV